MADGRDYTYVNGDDGYRGNILIEPDGYVTRSELYDVMAEVCRPVEVTVDANPGPAGICIGIAVVACLLAIVGWLSNMARRMP